MISRDRTTRGRHLATAMIVALCALAAQGLSPAAALNVPNKPNLILIVTDDQAVSDLYERTKPGRKGVPIMPETLRNIRHAGVSFSRAYASNPLSCPSRTTILTGQYAVNHHIYGNRWPGGGFCSDAGRLDLNKSLPVWLQHAGYRTSHYGRFLNGWGTQDETRVPPGWDRWVAAVDTKQSPAALYYGYHLNEDGVVSKQYGNPHARDPSNYFTDVIGHKAVDELLNNPNLLQPFFMVLDHRAPHEDLVPPIGPEPALRHAGTLTKKLPPRPPSFNEHDVSDKAPFLRQARRLTHGQINAIRRRNVRRLRTLRAVDDTTGYLFDALKATGELDETYVLFISDNGFFRGEHRIPKGKRRSYEPATRIPLMIRGPGLPAGRTSGELVANVDIAPTLLDLADASDDRLLDGRTLIPYAKAPGSRSARPILLESYYGRFIYDPEATVGTKKIAKGPPAPTPKTWKAIVVGRWKLVRYSKHVYELYDLKRDPHELRSLARRHRFRPVVAFLAHRLADLAKCQGSSCRRGVRAPKLPPKARPRKRGSSGGRP